MPDVITIESLLLPKMNPRILESITIVVSGNLGTPTALLAYLNVDRPCMHLLVQAFGYASSIL